MRNAPDAKSPLTLSALALALLVPLVGCDDNASEGRPQTDYDGVEDVDPDEYADGEEAPTVVEASSRWNASRGIDHHNYSNGEARPPEDCFMHLDTGHIGWDGNGPSDRQLTLGKAAIACGPMRLTVGYVDNWGRNRSMSEWTPSSGGWWQNEYEVNLDLMDGRRYPQYVQLCRTSVSPQACYTMYRPQG